MRNALAVDEELAFDDRAVQVDVSADCRATEISSLGHPFGGRALDHLAVTIGRAPAPRQRAFAEEREAASVEQNIIADRHVRDWALADIDFAAEREFRIVGEVAGDEAGRKRRVRIGERVHDGADERAAAKAEARLIRPGGPGGGSDEQAVDEARPRAVAAVRDHSAAGIVDELAAGETEVADRPPLRLDVHSGAGCAADHRAAGVAEFTVGEIVRSPGDHAESLPPVGAADEAAHMAASRPRRGPDDHRAVLRVMMAKDVRDGFRAGVLLENQPRRRNLPAGVAELPADVQPLDVAVQLDVADL